MQQDIVATSTQALNDKAAVDQELDHLSRCVASFQQRISQVTQFSLRSPLTLPEERLSDVVSGATLAHES